MKSHVIGIKEARAERILSSIEKIRKLFDENPDKLIEYVQEGVSRPILVLGAHIAQLAGKVRHPLKIGDDTYHELPLAFISPKRFDNIDLIINKARSMFRSYKVY